MVILKSKVDQIMDLVNCDNRSINRATKCLLCLQQSVFVSLWENIPAHNVPLV